MKAVIGETGYGTFGIAWEDSAYHERRGGYSGPFDDQGDAEQCAKDWASALDDDLTIIYVPNVNQYMQSRDDAR